MLSSISDCSMCLSIIRTCWFVGLSTTNKRSSIQSSLIVSNAARCMSYVRVIARVVDAVVLRWWRRYAASADDATSSSGLLWSYANIVWRFMLCSTKVAINNSDECFKRGCRNGSDFSTSFCCFFSLCYSLQFNCRLWRAHNVVVVNDDLVCLAECCCCGGGGGNEDDGCPLLRAYSSVKPWLRRRNDSARRKKRNDQFALLQWMTTRPFQLMCNTAREIRNQIRTIRTNQHTSRRPSIHNPIRRRQRL